MELMDTERWRDAMSIFYLGQSRNTAVTAHHKHTQK
jgi:hypothetical protein